MDLNQEEINSLFDLKKIPCDTARVNFPIQGEKLEVELQNDNGRITFQADISRSNKLSNKVTYQLRHKKVYVIRRLDLRGNHKNPPGPAPDEIFTGYEEAIFEDEDHLHFHIQGYGERWALPLSIFTEIGVLPEDDIHDKMLKFFRYCNAEDIELKITKTLLL